MASPSPSSPPPPPPMVSFRAKGKAREGGKSSTGLSAFIPSLRLHDVHVVNPSTSVNERLARARREGLHRRRGTQSRLASGSVEDSQETDGQPSFSSSSSSFNPTSTSTSASARAGLNYISASALRRKDVEEAQRNITLKRQLAGPVPPSSWKREFLDGRSGRGQSQREGENGARELTRLPARNKMEDDHVDYAHKGQVKGGEDADGECLSQARQRYHHLTPWEYSHPLRPPCPPYASSGRSRATLRDLCLSLVSEVISTQVWSSSSGLLDQATRLQIEQDVCYLPTHLKDRMMALATSGRTRYVLNEAAVQKLYFTQVDWEEEEESEQEENDVMRVKAHQIVEGGFGRPMIDVSFGDNTGDGEGDWEQDSIEDDPALTGWLTSATLPHHRSSLELSYAELSPATLRRLILGSPAASSIQVVNNVALRHLSLAGYSTGPSAGLSLPILTKSTFKILSVALPNLEHLSLAGLHLPFQALPSDVTQGVKQTTDALPWSILWRFCRKLCLLDLSYTTGLGACAVRLTRSVLGEQGAKMLLPVLECLLLKGSDANPYPVAMSHLIGPEGGSLLSGKRERAGQVGEEADPRGVLLPAFVSPCHARHWSRARRRRREDGGEESQISEPFTVVGTGDVGANDAQRLVEMARLIDTFRGRLGRGAKERDCEIWV